MSDIADLMAAVLAREVAAAHREGMRVLAVTSPLSLIAGLAAKGLDAPDLALAVGFGVLDAVEPSPAITLGEAALGTDLAHTSSAVDTFVAVARGFVGVCTSPAQLDARGAANLSRVGGTDERPGVALPGSRGVPDNNDMAGPVWYLFAAHGPRQLVPAVDFTSGPPPRPGRRRRLLTPLGVFALEEGGWTTVSRHPGVTAADVVGATGFAIAAADDVPTTPVPTAAELAAIRAADPHDLRALEHVDATEAARLVAAATNAEAVLAGARP